MQLLLKECQCRMSCLLYLEQSPWLWVWSQVPPALNRFTKAVDKNMAETVFKLLLKYRPEDKAAKKARLLAEVRAPPPPSKRCATRQACCLGSASSLSCQ